MSRTKHIQKLAQKLLGEGSYTDSLEKELVDVAHALKAGKYYTRVDSVARSGVSRIISIGYIKGGKLRCVSAHVYKLAGTDKNQRITGCGMDILFSAQNNLWRRLFPGTRYQGMPHYNDL
ncbi:MAG: hypothetical protein JKY96_02305 [Phycisphaerales bacterium]|nr:hypothetical protein [Phycisphaerales bacterium]